MREGATILVRALVAIDVVAAETRLELRVVDLAGASIAGALLHEVIRVICVEVRIAVSALK